MNMAMQSSVKVSVNPNPTEITSDIAKHLELLWLEDPIKVITVYINLSPWEPYNCR